MSGTARRRIVIARKETRQARKPRFAVPSVEKTAFFVAVFFLGGLLSAFGAAPFPAVKDHAVKAMTLAADIVRSRPGILQPTVYEGEGVVTHEAGVAQDGVTLVQGLLPGGAQIRMVDMEGNEIHRWRVDFFDIWPDPDHVVPAANIPKSRHNYHTQGFWPRADGSVLVNVSDLGAVLLDRCSRPVWTVDRMTHHSVTPAPGGKFWVPSHIPVHDTPAQLFPADTGPEETARQLVGTGKNYNNSVLLVNAKGEVEKEFSVLAAIHDAGLEHALYASRKEVPADPTHLNDIEIVTPALAAKIAAVEPGDILVSLRDMHMLAILDRDDGRLKWHRQGPWVRQHDPDIMPDGTIEIFNNRYRGLDPTVDTSQIVSFDPATGQTDVLHPVGDDDSFYSVIMGAHQRLGNGNVLITESLAGRVFETTPAGRVVWDYRLPYDDEVASLIEVSMRFGPDYFDVKDWTCKEN
ncbi:arylsulfotransferase family protein [Roseovarius salis]|uniref:arylsulfotransferase family protein n=1 Tax=Roseovarius salis TaxID=3376063 RepID=UPI0037C74008